MRRRRALDLDELAAVVPPQMVADGRERGGFLVGDQEIHVAVLVEVEGQHVAPPAVRITGPPRPGDLRKGQVLALEIELVGVVYRADTLAGAAHAVEVGPLVPIEVG